MTTDNRNKRSMKRFVLEKEYQFKWVILSVFSGLAVALFNIWSFYLIFKRNGLLGEGSELTAENWQSILWIGTGSVLLIIVYAAAALVLSHNAAGAVYQIKQTILAALDGDSNRRVNLRKNDEFKDLADVVNRLLDQSQKDKS